MSEAINEILEEEEEQLEQVAVFDDASAEYLMRRIAEANEQYDRMESWYKHQLEKAKKIRDDTVALAEMSLRAYLDMVPVKKTKTQVSYEFPGGKLVLKAQGPEYERDDAALVPWLKENGLGDLVKVKETANWAELKKGLKESPDGTAMVTADGEIVPGVKVTQREPEFKAIPNTKNH